MFQHLRIFADAGQIFSQLRSRLYLQKHVSYTHQMVVEDFSGYVKEPEQSRVGDGVIHIAPRFASDHDVARSQNCKLLRNVCGLDLSEFR